MSPANKKILEQLAQEIKTYRSSLRDPMSMRYTKEQKITVVSLVQQGISSNIICRALGIPTERLRLWQKDPKFKSAEDQSFKQVAITKVSPPEPLQFPSHQEARIETKDGLTIFIPLSALTSTLLVNLGGCR